MTNVPPSGPTESHPVSEAVSIGTSKRFYCTVDGCDHVEPFAKLSQKRQHELSVHEHVLLVNHPESSLDIEENIEDDKTRCESDRATFTNSIPPVGFLTSYQWHRVLNLPALRGKNLPSALSVGNKEESSPTALLNSVGLCTVLMIQRT
ncbi:hypothetical protein MBANPS3_008288 [Mucor bainieri]